MASKQMLDVLLIEPVASLMTSRIPRIKVTEASKLKSMGIIVVMVVAGEKF